MNIVLKKDKEKNLLRQHPWVFSGAIHKIEGIVKELSPVRVISGNNEFLGWGIYSPTSQIRVRLLSFKEAVYPDKRFLQEKLTTAVKARNRLLNSGNNAVRLVYAESDGLPGIVIDQYNDFFVCQFLNLAGEYYREDLIELINELYHPKGIYERSDAKVREKEGLSIRTGVISGEMPPDTIEIMENGLKLLVDIKNGHKTGLYLDQKDNRSIVSYYAEGSDVLNCFCYTGAFSVYALKHGAKSVINADISESALKLAEQNAAINNLPIERLQTVKADLFQLLRDYEAEGREFDLIILDPPKFIENKSNVIRGARGYKDINMLAFKLLKTGGILMTFSCSGLLDSLLFQKIIADAALDAGCNAQIIQKMTQASDHPIGIFYPESFYLKGLVLRKV
ncbi:MAG: class I SAM-dependent methyltransferase [Candidatus Cloacimonetes bacterium]|nr:class I SAM-dependent methyltransferase [Candidatus Cloacimonadota bacterium]